jgi:hypothetical protein
LHPETFSIHATPGWQDAKSDRRRRRTGGKSRTQSERLANRVAAIFHRASRPRSSCSGRTWQQAELNGWAESRQTEQRRPIGFDGDKLVATPDERFGSNAKWLADLASGSYDEINRFWERGLRASQDINAKDFDYKGHDPAYEFGGSGGQIQNSNSVAYTLSRTMGLDADTALRSSGTERVFSGWGRDLLDPKYKRYVASPVFPIQNAP